MMKQTENTQQYVDKLVVANYNRARLAMGNKC